MATTLKAIETIYKGYRFRSRLEARWAVFLDALGVTFEYEPQGFDLNGIWYLPDFYIPDLECWVEIKPRPLTTEEIAKAERLAIASQQPVYVFWGDLPYPSPAASWTDSADLYAPVWDDQGIVSAYGDNARWWTECTRCGGAGIAYRGEVTRLDEEECHHVGGPDTPRLRDAYLSARQARFDQRGR